MLSKSEKGREIRQYFIQIEKNYKKLLKDKFLLDQHKLTLEYQQFRLE
jgi:phage anti-repressor protein